MVDVEVRIGSEELTVELREEDGVMRETVRVEVVPMVVVLLVLVDAVEFEKLVAEVALTRISAVPEEVIVLKVL